MPKLNGLLKDIHVEDVPKSQWNILLAKNNIDPDLAKLNSDKFNVLNTMSATSRRSLGGENVKKDTADVKIDPSYTAASAVMKNRYHEEFWKIKDPSRIAVTPTMKDPLGYEDGSVQPVASAEVKNDHDT